MTAISSPVRASGLSAAQLGVLIAFGAVLWFVAALLMRAIEPLGAFHGLGVLLLYALVIPATVPFVWLTRAMAKLRPDQIGIGVAVVTGAASLLDGNALVWIPGLYGADPKGAAAAILWGVGVGLFLGLVMNRSDAG